MVIDLWEWKRARLGAMIPPMHRRARPSRRREENSGFVGVDVISLELLRRLIDCKEKQAAPTPIKKPPAQPVEQDRYASFGLAD